MAPEQEKNRSLTEDVSAHTLKRCLGRPPKPEHLVRSKILPIRLTVDEFRELESAVERLGVTVADTMRDGARLYIQSKSKDGSSKGKEQNH
jgi:hypothetical protein